MIISLVYGQIQTPSEQDGYAAIAKILAPSGYVSPPNVDLTVQALSIKDYVGSRTNGKYSNNK